MVSPASKPFVAQIDIALAAKMRTDLEQKDFSITVPAYTVFSAKSKDVTCTLYLSGKLVVQGKGMMPFIEFYLEPEVLHSFQHSRAELLIDTTPRIGMDESGKGDFFGPLCIAGVFASGPQVQSLLKLGVCDSKALNDATVSKLAPQIEALCPHYSMQILPTRYNTLYSSFGNLNHLLAWGHATVIEHLVTETGCRTVTVDQFAYEHVMLNALKRKQVAVDLTQRHRAEEDVVVAAASILARHSFLKGLQHLSQEYSITLPKGASSAVIAAGKQLVAKHGREALKHVAKMHFKTVDTIIPPFFYSEKKEERTIDG
jgi:ribonuclease HIII